MDAMTEQLARMVIQQRVAGAAEARAGHRIEKEHRRRRWRRWSRRWGRTPAAATPVTTAGPPAPVPAPVPALVPALVPPVEPAVEVATLLARAADRLTEQGTAGERPLLEAMAEISAGTAPGAAAALVDWSGTETSRLRAFGLLHGHVLEALGPSEHVRFLDLLDGVDQAAAVEILVA